MGEQRHDFAVSARFIAPRVSLASCVRGFMARSTLGQPLLAPEQRLNHFPASPLCGVTWFIEGSTRIVDAAAPFDGTPLPRVVFCGPQSRPFTSYNPGPVHAFMVLFFPPALQALTGIDLSHHLDRFTAVDATLDGHWTELSRQVLTAGDDGARVLCVERFLEPLWHAARERGAAPGGLLDDWVHALGARAAAAGWGRSARSLERRIKAAAGQPLRTLRRMARIEQSFLDARGEMRTGAVSWADVAARRGYADQAHLCREVRDVTGHSPTELARRTREDESYWVYRVWPGRDAEAADAGRPPAAA